MKFIYFVNPMCSWCWGFSPVLEKIKESYPTHSIRIVLTPFRIDTHQPMDSSLRDYVMGQWHKVYKTTAQPFDFNFSMPEEFIYNTRLACLSIKAFCKQLPQLEIEYLRAMQHAFYAENKDLTDQDILIDVARYFSINEAKFIGDLKSDEVLSQLNQDFDFCQKHAIQSYPTLMAESRESYAVLTSGYASFEKIAAIMSSEKATL